MARIYLKPYTERNSALPFEIVADGTVHGFQWLDVTGGGISVILSTTASAMVKQHLNWFQ